jgi:hypothetical protein
MVARNRSAQVMLEYLVIAVVVMAAVIYGGPVLVNSIGAHFRIAEDNVGDSFSEKPKQASAPLCACNPTSSNPRAWPVIGKCGEDGCAPLENKRQRLCPGCTVAKEEKCAESRQCCGSRVKGACGTVNPTAASLCVNREYSITESGQKIDGRCLDAGGSVQGCMTDESSYTWTCGEGVTVYECEKDTGSCGGSCVSQEWKEDPSTVCEGKEFTQTGDCKDTRKAYGTKPPECPPASSVACGEKIASINGCGECSGTGSGGVSCPPGYECKNNGCELICDYQPTGIYQAAHYFKACRKQGSTGPGCPSNKWVRDDYWDGGSWHCSQCGILYKEAGTICHGSPCTRGILHVHGDGNYATFHRGKYNAVTKTCDANGEWLGWINSSGYLFDGDNNGYSEYRSSAIWGQ